MNAEGKKRYQITLTEENYLEFQKVAKELNFPPSFLSQLLDGQLVNLTKTFRAIQEKGAFTFTDMFTMIGSQLESLNSTHEAPKTVKISNHAE